MSNYPNIIKVRDDHEPTFFGVTSITEDEPDNKNSKEMKFTSDPNSKPAWLNGSESFSHRDLRSRIEPWLTALFQSEHLSLLAGAGITHAIHYIAANEPAAGMAK